MNEYIEGDKVRISASFTDENGSAIDPDGVYLEIKIPGYPATQYFPFGITRDGVGQYHVDVSLTYPGQWHYYWYSTGTGQAANQETFHVVAKNTG